MSEDPIVALTGQVEALEGWRKQMLAVHAAADDRLRPLLKDVPDTLGRHVYDVAADEIVRLRAEVERLRDGILAALDNLEGGPEAIQTAEGALRLALVDG